ncbi:MAG: arginyltransferase [Alphaproteobacteria bacterium]|nr:arginyltransferase [Alphaproteobacteria bacterium]
MRHAPTTGAHFFFTTAPLPCPYLAGRTERRLVTELLLPLAPVMNDQLSMAGFRRSHTIAYTPVCEGCSACVSVRIPVREFRPNKTQRRIFNRNADVRADERPPVATPEQFRLFQAYITARHGDGDMAGMDDMDYRGLIEDTPVNSQVVEFRDGADTLVAACLVDRLACGLSAVYSFYDVEQEKRSLGVFMVLWLVERAREMGLDHVYLGYWVEGCRKMDYKRNYRPLEAYTPRGWERLDGTV